MDIERLMGRSRCLFDYDYDYDYDNDYDNDNDNECVRCSTYF